MQAHLLRVLPRTARFGLALIAAFSLAAPAAMAQRLEIGFGKHGRHGSVGVHLGIGHARPPIVAKCKPPIVIAPPCPPPVHPPMVWVPGHWALVEKQVYVPGCVRKEYVPPVYETRTWRDYAGRLHVERIEVAPATWRTVQDPGTWRTVSEQVWVEGRWQATHL